MTSAPTMETLAQEYLTLRRQLGYALHSTGQHLLSFARYADGLGHRGPITIELAVRWARLPQGARPQWWARRLQIVSGFAQHRSLFEPDTEIPPAGLLGPHFRRTTPHIYSNTEISALLRAASEIGPAGGLRAHTHVTLFGLLFSSGLRISEALHLGRDDVDLKSGVLTVIRTKFRKSRMVPLHPSTTRALAGYVGHRDRLQPQAAARTFFLNDHGAPVGVSGVTRTFGILRRQLGWSKGFGGGFQLLGFILFTVAGYAETNRTPFDLPEAEGELVAGYHTEYSGMRFAAFFMAEYINMMTASALGITLFLGGWQLGIPVRFQPEPGFLLWGLQLSAFVAKMTFFQFLFVWVRWTLPRFRYDQLMNLGWKGLLPLSLANLAATAILVVYGIVGH